MALLLVSNNILVRERWKSILAGDYRLVEATSISELLDIGGQDDTAMTLCHRNIADMEAIIELARTPLMVFADVPNDLEAVMLFRAGVLGYANTYLSAQRLHQALNAALSGQVWIGHALMQRIINGSTNKALKRGEPIRPTINVTDREWEIALLVGKGQSNLEIAAQLDISERTVKAHIGSIFKKTGTQSRLQLALLIRNQVPEQ